MSIYIIIWDRCLIVFPNVRYRGIAVDNGVRHIEIYFKGRVAITQLDIVQATEIIRISPVLNYCQRDIMSQEKGIE